MPELPEVESIVRRVRRRLVGHRIVGFDASWARQVLPSVNHVRRATWNRTVMALTRRGKYVVMDLDDGGLLAIHLRMSGRLEWRERTGQPPLPHTRAVWRFEDGSALVFCDARKFGRIESLPDAEHLGARLGIEPRGRGFTVERLAAALRGRRRRLKPLLLDQTTVAGLGNIYTDEALHRAGLHPLLASDFLTDRQLVRLHAAIREVLDEGIRRNGASIDWAYPGGRMQDHFRVYGRRGEPCTGCGSLIEYIRVAQRGTHLCPRCQPAPAPEE